MRIFFFTLLNFLIFNILADNIDYLSFSSGVFDFMRENHRTVELRAEYRPSFNLQTLRPIFGIMATGKGALYFYSGLGLDLFFTTNFYFSPSLAPGIYYKGKGKNLGFPIEFRSGIEIGWRFENKYRLALQMCHISNASLGNRNPGCESLVLSLYTPIRIGIKKSR
jgi:lipid A 3-O-deacylase